MHFEWKPLQKLLLTDPVYISQVYDTFGVDAYVLQPEGWVMPDPWAYRTWVKPVCTGIKAVTTALLDLAFKLGKVKELRSEDLSKRPGENTAGVLLRPVGDTRLDYMGAHVCGDFPALPPDTFIYVREGDHTENTGILVVDGTPEEGFRYGVIILGSFYVLRILP